MASAARIFYNSPSLQSRQFAIGNPVAMIGAASFAKRCVFSSCLNNPSIRSLGMGRGSRGAGALMGR